MASYLPFENFWTFATTRAQQKNPLSYHSCCDVWTTRNSKLARASHRVNLTWSDFLASLKRSILDKKNAMQVELIERGMQVPLQINKPCENNLISMLGSKRGRKPLKKSIHQNPLVPPYPSLDFNQTNPNQPQIEEDGIIYC